MRILFTWLMLVSFLLALSDLKPYAKIFPKILAYDYNLENKLYDRTIRLGILYDAYSQEEAQQLKTLITRYNPEVSGFKLVPLLIETAEFARTPRPVTALLIMGETEDPEIYRRVREFAVRHSVVVFAIRMEDVKQNATIGLFFGKSVRPIINKRLLLESNIRFKTTFLKFAKVYDE